MNGLRSKSDNSDFVSFLRTFDIVFLTETWGDEHFEFTMNNYVSYNFSRKKRKQFGRHSGGISVLFRSQYENNIRVEQNASHSDIIWVLIENNNLKLGVAVVYFSPRGSSTYSSDSNFSCLEDELAVYTAKYPNYKFIVCGDFNARTANLPDYHVIENNFIPSIDDVSNEMRYPTRISKDETCNTYGRLLLGLCKNTGLRIANGRLLDDQNTGHFTCMKEQGGSVIDYVLTKYENFDLFSEFRISNRPESDHQPVIFSLKNTIRTIVNGQQNDHLTNEKIYKWKEEHKNDYKSYWEGEKGLEVIRKVKSALTRENIAGAAAILMESVHESVKNMVNYTSIKNNNRENRRHKSWFDKDCTQIKILVQRSLNKFRNTRTEFNRKIYLSNRKLYQNIIRQKKNDFNEAEKLKLIIASRNPNANQFWSLVSVRRDGPSRKIKLEEWFDHFSCLFSDHADQNRNTAAFVEEAKLLLENLEINHDEHFGDVLVDNSILDDDITRGELIKSISRLKLNKAPGIDATTPGIWINSPPVLIDLILELFNHILYTGIFPSEWSRGLIVPLHKKGAKDDVRNYRGITLLPIINKIFCDIVFHRIQLWSDKYYPLVEEQAGFRKKFTTADNIFVLHTVINRYLSIKGRLYCAFIDFEKAFDRVCHCLLFYKLFKKGMKGKLFSVLRSMYSDVTACLRTPVGLSNFFKCELGVQQGNILSPLLFTLFINDLGEALNTEFTGVYILSIKLFFLLYADDLALFSSTPIGLQRLLDKLSLYTTKWKLKINLSKSKIMVFRNAGRLKSCEKWSIEGHRLEVVNEYCYLGVVFSCTGLWNCNQKYLAEKATKSLYSIKQMLNRYPNIDISSAFKVFDGKIMPILMYGSEIWGLHNGENIEIVHNNFCRFILKVHNNASTLAVRGELGRFTVRTVRLARVVKYWLRLLSLPQQRLTSICYAFQYQEAENNKSCWANDVKQLLFSIGMGEAWFNQGVGCCQSFLNLFKQRCKDIAIQEWQASVQLSSKLHTYCKIKVDFGLSCYLSVIDKYYLKNALCKFRISAHSLRIETGRWLHNNRTERICSVCTLNEIEDEFHFMLICPLYNDMRLKYLPQYCFINPTRVKFIAMLQTEQRILLLNLSKYIYFATKRRTETEME